MDVFIALIVLIVLPIVGFIAFFALCFRLGTAIGYRAINWIQKKIQARVAEINAEHSLSFDAELEHVLLGEENQEFMAFDQQHRKLVLASCKDKTLCRIEDFSWLRGWSHTSESTHSTTSSSHSPMYSSHRTTLHTRHRIELQTADLNCPVLFFNVTSKEGPEWIARLDLLINGQPRERLR